MPAARQDWTYQNLDLSPDGRTLTYSTEGVVAGFTQPQWRIHLVDLATGVDRPMRFDPTARGEAQLRFSPDGRTAVIVRFDTGVRLAVVSLDGSAPARAVGPTYSGREQLTTLFSPDGRTFVLLFDAPRGPVLLDLVTGSATTVEGARGMYASWQRRAP